VARLFAYLAAANFSLDVAWHSEINIPTNELEGVIPLQDDFPVSVTAIGVVPVQITVITVCVTVGNKA